ncbi:hypothetical protein D0Y65_018686 [Glycine soja]|uniref:Uncharacterized protein n=1 Tax=Glycine soja TaxID=3848 RepID=A0A445K095_GLYSO|nr:hypothetical protein D0Y65_018686 [Glycine soja]
MKTTRDLIDMDDVQFKIRVQDEEVVCNVFKAVKHLNDDKSCLRVDVLDEMYVNSLKQVSNSSSLEKALIDAFEALNEEEEMEIEDCLKSLDTLKEIPKEVATLEELSGLCKKSKKNCSEISLSG